MDIADPGSVQAAFDELAPWAVVNAAEYVRVDEAERESEVCRRWRRRSLVTYMSAGFHRTMRYNQHRRVSFNLVDVSFKLLRVKLID